MGFSAVGCTRMSMIIWVIIVVAVLQGTRSCNGVLVPYGSNASSTLPFRLGFYNTTCPSAEAIVQTTIQSAFSDVRVPARILRMLFHECFYSGCDGSLLVNSTGNNTSEQVAAPNLSVAGYDVIDAAKAALELACPGIVSCADIQVLMARDAIALLGGPAFQVPTGRLDTRAVTTAAQASKALPSDAARAPTVLAAFGGKGFTPRETVTLLGAHTVGAAFCSTINYRLWNDSGSGNASTTMDPNLVSQLKGSCPQVIQIPDGTVALDQGSNTINVIDNSYYQQLILRHGILDVDQNLIFNNVSGPIVTGYAGTTINGTTTAPTLNFITSFAAAIIKLGTLDVITGNSTRGSIRTQCSVLN